jgi:hypothetical protein
MYPKSNIMGVKTQKVAISATMIIDKSTLAKNVEQTVFKVVEPNRVKCKRMPKGHQERREEMESLDRRRPITF